MKLPSLTIIQQVLLISCIGFLSPNGASAAPGDIDPLFSSQVFGGDVQAMAVQANGLILVGGRVSQAGGVPCEGLARIFPDGSADLSFNPAKELNLIGVRPIFVDGLKIQKDGKILASGWFSGNYGVAGPEIMRFHPDGSVDASFQMPAGGTATVFELQHDGKILVGGTFWVNGVYKNLLRLNPDGSIDDSFPLLFNSEVAAIAVLDDGRIMMGGDFTGVDGTTQDYLVRLKPDGSLDATFNSTTGSTVQLLAIQADGKVIAVMGTPTGTLVLKRFGVNGALDPTFSATAEGGGSTRGNGLVLQTDGKVLLSGNFSTVNGISRTDVVRLLPTGAVDTTFQVPVSTQDNYTRVILEPGGKILMGGSFSYIGNVSSPPLVRLQNNAATSALEMDGSSLRWLRSGSAPEIGQVSFEVRDSNTGEWNFHSAGTRVPGGWTAPITSLPAAGTVRVTGWASPGQRSHEQIAGILSFGGVQPVLKVDGPDGTTLTSGAVAGIGSVLSGYSGAKSFLIRNPGDGVLSGVSFSFSGSGASDFKIANYSPRNVGPGDSLPFSVRFSPSGTGQRSALLTISSNNPGGSFTVNLIGSGSTAFSPFFGSADEVPIRTSQFDISGKSFGTLGLGFAPEPGTVLTAIDQTSAYSFSAPFPDLPDGGVISATYNGITYEFMAGYKGGVGDLTLTLKGPGFPRRDFSTPVGEDATAIAVNNTGRMMVVKYAGSLLKLMRQDGSLIESFAPDFKNGLTSSVSLTKVVACPDGSFVVGGTFDTVNGSSRKALARFDGDGNFDASFAPVLAGEWVSALAVQNDGKILLAGGDQILTVRRLNPDGSTDTGFSVIVDGGVNLLAQLADGRLLMGGGFNQVNGLPNKDLVRLNPDGSLDPSFHFTSGLEVGDVGALVEQADGKVVLADGAGMSSARLRRILVDGSMDPGFAPDFGSNAGATFNSLAIQGDGKLLVGGGFNEVNGRTRTSMVRFNPDGSVDPSFVCSGSNSLMVLRKDGEILVNGGIVDGATFKGLLRLLNGPAQMDLEIPDMATVRLRIGGTAPQVRGVILDTLASGASQWSALPSPSRIEGGWQLSGASLPAAGIVRWRAIPLGNTSSSSVIEGYVNLAGAVPDISVAGPAGEPLPSGGNVAFGPVLAGHSRTLKLRVTNHGDGIWDDFSTSFSGPNGAGFAIVAAPERGLLPGETGVFEVRFTPGSTGSETSVLSLASNDAPQSPYVISFSGEGGNLFDPEFYEPDDVVIRAASFTATNRVFGALGLNFAPVPGTKLIAVDNTGTAAISGRFSDLPDGALISATYGGISYGFLVGYAGGDGNDLTLSLLSPGVLDVSSKSTLASGSVSVSVPLEDGGTLIGGSFTTVNGVSINRLARLKGDGSLDTSFNPNINGAVEAIHRFEDGSMLVAGDFTTVGGETAGRIVRLRPDGSLDPMFMVAPDKIVRTMLVQPDRRILIGGDFVNVNGATRNRIARLNADGSLDMGFNPNASSSVRVLALQSDGRILIGGSFTTLGGIGRTCVARLMDDGTLDGGFVATMTNTISSPAMVAAIHLQADGKIVLGSSFKLANGAASGFLCRLLDSGATDTSFLGSTNSTVQSIAAQADGKILIGGAFNLVNGFPRKLLARLTADGSLDDSFFPDMTGSSVSQIVLRPDGRIQTAGLFGIVNGVSRLGFVRLLNDDPSSAFELVGPSVIRWIRGGPFPHETSVALDIHESGISGWRSLGDARRIDGGWELVGLSLPAAGVIRARAEIDSGRTAYLNVVASGVLGTGNPMLILRDLSGDRLPNEVSELAFGSVPTSWASTVEIEIANDGSAPLENITATLAGSAAADFSVTSAPASSLPATGVTRMSVRFTPSEAGTREAELRIVSSDPTANPLVIPLTGSGGTMFTPVVRAAGEIPLSSSLFDLSGKSFGGLELRFHPSPGTALVAIENKGSAAMVGTLSGLPDQSMVTAVFEGETYHFLATYRGGSGNDLVFVLMGPGVADPTFDPQPNLAVHAIAGMNDGGALVAGDFNSLGGVPAARIGRIARNGSVAPVPLSLAARAEAMAVQRDGKVLVCKTTTASDGTVRTNLARVREDGSLDASFAPVINGSVNAAIELQGGGILIAGSFTMVGTVTKTGLALLNPDGSLNTGFNATVVSSYRPYVTALAEQEDGNILIGGAFGSVNGSGRSFLARLSPSGVLDGAFNAGLTGAVINSTVVTCLVCQPDGRILVGGNLTGVGGVPRSRLVRLNPDGTLDNGFLAVTDQAPTAMLIQSDGGIIVTGYFTKVNGGSRPGIARLLANGALDPDFKPRPLGYQAIYSVSADANGDLLIGGEFSSFAGIGKGKLARLAFGEGPSNPVVTDATTIVWNRGDFATEVRDASFALSTNGGSTWLPLGPGIRTESGWAITGLSLPESGHIRVTGTGLMSNRGAALFSGTSLFGRSATAVETWRSLWFGTELNEGQAADDADPDGDGLENLMEFALGLNPRNSSAHQVPDWSYSAEACELSFVRPDEAAGIIYEAEWSENLRDLEWHLAEDLSSGNNLRFRVPLNGRQNLFFRIKVTDP